VLPDRRHALCASWDNSIKIWEIDSGRIVGALVAHSGMVAGISITQDGKRAVSTGEDKAVKVWDLVRGAVIASFGCDSSLRSCALSVNGRDIVAGDAQGTVHFLRLMMPRQGVAV
jgi:WD40 repeat protein